MVSSLSLFIEHLLFPAAKSSNAAKSATTAEDNYYNYNNPYPPGAETKTGITSDSSIFFFHKSLHTSTNLIFLIYYMKVDIKRE
jgi:hypothetical protein